MNVWLATASVLLVAGFVPVVWGVATGPLGRGVAAQNLGTSVVCLAILLLSQGYDRPSYVDVALVVAVLGPVGTLVYARLLADELQDDPPHTRLFTVSVVCVTVPVVVALCLAGGPGRAAAKLVLVGVLLVVGNVIAFRALTGGFSRSEVTR
ncbi:monovalent cation/H+ antiporter complex subunit F [Streptomyces umbrinus]|uniref:monovalent cation/H+ antiporter complex subunit F n=1 Tax=Streptomyces umbrinus TaxID=67370 RepID=UPI0034139A2D